VEEVTGTEFYNCSYHLATVSLFVCFLMLRENLTVLLETFVACELLCFVGVWW